MSSLYLYGWGCLRKQMGAHLMHHDQMFGVIKLRAVSQQLPSVPTLLQLLNQMHVLYTHVWWLCLALLCPIPCNTGSLYQGDSSNQHQEEDTRSDTSPYQSIPFHSQAHVSGGREEISTV